MKMRVVLSAALALCVVVASGVPSMAWQGKKHDRTDNMVPNTVMVRLKPGALTSGSVASLLGFHEAYASRQVLLEQQSVAYNAAVRKKALLQSSAQLQEMLRAEEPLLRTFALRYSGSEPPDVVARRLVQQHAEVEIAEPAYAPRLLAGEPNDPLFAQQTMLKVIKAVEAWDVYSGDASMVIAISDDGTNQEHEDLQHSIWINTKEIPNNNIDDDGNGYVDDYNGYNFAAQEDSRSWGNTYNSRQHGVSVAGILGAEVNNALGIAGIANKCKIFPLKIAPYGTQSLDYGYESIVYAAVNGFKVLNCSWGIDTYSDINQSIIDFAVSRDVAIVAAGGNDGDSRLVFPAAYKGVLGVGNSWPDDGLAGTSAFGAHIDIIAPGEGAHATANTGYTVFDGTSSATPIVSGTLALVRALHPNLSNLQAMEFLRRCTDNIEAKNPPQQGLIPGRLNMYKAVTLNPLDKPSVGLVSHQLKNAQGTVVNRFGLNEEIELVLTIKNYLRAADGFLLQLSIVGDPQNSMEVVKREITTPALATGQSAAVGGLSVRKLQENSQTVFLRVDIAGDPDYQDYFLIPLRPSFNAAEFSNDSLSFALTDAGQIGFATRMKYPEDVGIRLRSYGNLLYEAGMFACANGSKVVSATRSHIYSSLENSTLVDNDFSTVKPFLEPNRTIGVLRDNNASNPIGLEVREEAILPSGGAQFARVVVTVKNVSGNVLNNVSLGYFFDWDIGRYGEDNRMELKHSSTLLSGGSMLWGFASRAGAYPVAGCGVYSEYNGAQAQYASFENYSSSLENPFNTATVDGFAQSNKILALTQGTLLQYPNTGDIGCVVGMKFPGEWPADEERSFTLLLGASWSESALQQAFETVLRSVPVSETENVPALHIVPQPVRDVLTVGGIPAVLSPVVLTVVNAMGMQVLPAQTLLPASEPLSAMLNVQALPSGVYFVRADNGSHVYTLPFVVVK